MIGYTDITFQVTTQYGMTYEMAKALPFCIGLKLEDGRIYAPVHDTGKVIASVKLRADILGLGDFAPDRIAARAAAAEARKAAATPAPVARPAVSSYTRRAYCPGCGLDLDRHGSCAECGVMDVY